MAGPIVHKYFFDDCVTNSGLQTTVKNNNKNIYAQGHDLLLYIDLFHFLHNRNISLIMSNYNFQEFVYNYLHLTLLNDSIYNSCDVKLFLYGYISHHVLDSYFHPFIMQYDSNYLPVYNEKWIHGKIESIYDTKFIEEKRANNTNKYKCFLDFIYKDSNSLHLIGNAIEKSVYKTYNIIGSGVKFEKGITGFANHMKLYRYDPLGIKKRIALITKNIVRIGAEDFFYDKSNLNELKNYTNDSHNVWINRFNNKLSSDNFEDIYKKSLETTIEIIDNIENILKNNSLMGYPKFSKIIPNVSAITGDKCGKKLKFIKNYGGKIR